MARKASCGSQRTKMIRAILLAGYGANFLLGFLPSDDRTDDEKSRVSNEAQLRLNLILVLRSELICSKCCPRRNLISQLTTLEKYAELSNISFIPHESCEFVSLSTFSWYPYSVANLLLHSCISTLLHYALSFHNLRPLNRGLPSLPPLYKTPPPLASTAPLLYCKKKSSLNKSRFRLLIND